MSRPVPEALREASPWIERLARLGFVAKAAVYVIVGGLAAKAGFGMGGRTIDTRGALPRERWAEAGFRTVVLGNGRRP